MFLSQLARLGNDVLRRAQNGLAVAALVVAVCPVVLLLVLAFRAIWTAGDGETLAIIWEGEDPAGEYGSASWRAAQEDDKVDAIETPFPAVDWSERDLRRQAASTLSRGGDLQGALEILPEDDPDRTALTELTDSRHQEVLQILEDILPEEEGKTGVALIRSYGRRLPDNSFYRFMVNLHCRLRDRSRASDAYVKLLLESCFPPASAGRTLYRESKTLRPFRGGVTGSSNLKRSP
jgi:hypothetical protein